jgi:hypothetical protein
MKLIAANATGIEVGQIADVMDCTAENLRESYSAFIARNALPGYKPRKIYLVARRPSAEQHTLGARWDVDARVRSTKYGDAQLFLGTEEEFLRASDCI